MSPPAAYAERQLAALLERFDPPIRTLVREARRALRKRMPTAVELVYDNYNTLAIGFASSERRGDWIVSLATYARGVNLYFIYGVALDDPQKLLQGSGSSGRFLRLESAKQISEPAVAALITAAIAEADTPLPRTGRGSLIIKSISPNTRRRRAGG